jgi:hypothetical protein
MDRVMNFVVAMCGHRWRPNAAGATLTDSHSACLPGSPLHDQFAHSSQLLAHNRTILRRHSRWRKGPDHARVECNRAQSHISTKFIAIDCDLSQLNGARVLAV